MCTQTHYKHDEDGHTAPGVCGRGSVPLSHSGLTGINLISKTIAPPIYKLLTDSYGNPLPVVSECPPLRDE